MLYFYQNFKNSLKKKKILPRKYAIIAMSREKCPFDTVFSSWSLVKLYWIMLLFYKEEQEAKYLNPKFNISKWVCG